MPKQSKLRRLVSRAKTSGNLKNSNLKTRIKAVTTELRKP